VKSQLASVERAKVMVMAMGCTHDPHCEPAGFSRTWILRQNVSPRYSVPYVPLMAYRTSRRSRVAVWIRMLPLLQELLCLLQQRLQ
jgi:hypothetical protein